MVVTTRAAVLVMATLAREINPTLYNVKIKK
jgi:hypothetical protein